MISFLKGKKTYIAAVLMAIAGAIMGDIELVLQALAIAGIREAIDSK